MNKDSIPELMESIPQYFVPEKAEGINAIIQFHIRGNKGGDWFVTIKNLECSVAKGTALNPRVTFSAEAQDCLDILTDKLDGLKAYMTGKLELKGDIKLAMKIASFFKLDQ
jgi:putative sterol carrier protein